MAEPKNDNLVPTEKKNKKIYTKEMFSSVLNVYEEKFINELQKDPTNITRAARIAFPDANDPAQKGWQELQKEKVYKAYAKSMKVWNKVLNVPKLLKNLDESLNAMKPIVHDGAIVDNVPDHQARNVARDQALKILGILDKNRVLGKDDDGNPIQAVQVVVYLPQVNEQKNICANVT